jgi:hypothetical protein
MNYKIITVILITSVLSIFMSSCSDETTTTPSAEKETTATGSFSAEINEAPFTSTSTFGLLSRDSVRKQQALFITGITNGKECTIAFGEAGLSDAFSEGTGRIGYFRIDENETEKIYEPISSSVTVTKSDASTKTVSGTFYFTGEEVTSKELINVQKGTFTDVRYEVDGE